jgi:hypothetical protein
MLLVQMMGVMWTLTIMMLEQALERGELSIRQ